MKPNTTHATGAKTTTSTSKSSLVPTNTVSTKDGASVRARIDPALPVADVVKQLCANLKVPENSALYALRGEQDELVTDENLRKKIQDKVNLKLVNSPAVEAIDIVEKLSSREDKSLRLALYSLQKYIREEQFLAEFLKRDGLLALLNVISVSHGNTLAYALKALQSLMSLDYGWGNIPRSFISKLIEILSDPSNLVNVSRPATSILKRLVEADPRSASQGVSSGTPSFIKPQATGNAKKGEQLSTKQSMSTTKLAPDGVWCYGFDLVFDEMKAQGQSKKSAVPTGEGSIQVMETVVKRLSSGDSMMVMDSMLLINALLKNATDRGWEELANELERLNVRKAVVRLTSQTQWDDLSSSILEFQANLMSLAYRRKTTPVDPSSTTVQRALETIWTAAQRPSSEKGRNQTRKASEGSLFPAEPLRDSWSEPGGQNRMPESWTSIGFESENIRAEFARVGLLGLDCLRVLAASSRESFADMVFEQYSRPPERRCLVAKASNEVVELLSEHYQIFAPGYSTSSSFQPYFLSFHRVHNLALRFFLRIWNESAATSTDFDRVVALVQSQIKYALRDESRPWHEVERDFLESEYRKVRQRQMRELEVEDDLLNKPPVRTLRAKLYKDSFDFVRSQRIHCLMQGAWFSNGTPLPQPGTQLSRDSMSIRRPTRSWRYMRLDKGMRYLHYVDSVVKIPIRNGLEDLPERIDVSLILEVTTSTCVASSNLHLGGTPSDVPAVGMQVVPSPLSFSLLSIRGGSLGDLVAENSTSYSDWIDGLSMLRGDHFSTKETTEFVQTLTEIGLKIKLLDLSGERVDIPNILNPPPLPASTDFFFSDYD